MVVSCSLGRVSNGRQATTIEKGSKKQIRILRQKLHRQNDIATFRVVDLTGLEVEEGETDVDVRAELKLLKERHYVEDERLRRFVHGSGQGRLKSAEFEFAARTILATGCSAQAAKDITFSLQRVCSWSRICF
jgi:hypothetical protein